MDKEFVGINITYDEHFNYYMDQTRMITVIVKEANLTGAKEEKLPYPMGNLPQKIKRKSAQSTPIEELSNN